MTNLQADGEGSAGRHPEIDTDRPHAARLYDFFLGGRTNYRVDREQAVKVVRVCPEVFTAARHNRAFTHRATRRLARYGIVRTLMNALPRAAPSPSATGRRTSRRSVRGRSPVSARNRGSRCASATRRRSSGSSTG